jgi:hypothetical protein
MSRKARKKMLLLFVLALLLGFATAFWLFYKPQEFIYTFF